MHEEPLSTTQQWRHIGTELSQSCFAQPTSETSLTSSGDECTSCPRIALESTFDAAWRSFTSMLTEPLSNILASFTDDHGPQVKVASLWFDEVWGGGFFKKDRKRGKQELKIAFTTKPDAKIPLSHLFNKTKIGTRLRYFQVQSPKSNPTLQSKLTSSRVMCPYVYTKLQEQPVFEGAVKLISHSLRICNLCWKFEIVLAPSRFEWFTLQSTSPGTELTETLTLPKSQIIDPQVQRQG